MKRIKKSKIPNPGTQAAIDAGCICPVLDNEHGEGILMDGKQCFWYTEGCPVHTRKEKGSSRKKQEESKVDPMEWKYTYSDKADCCRSCIHSFKKEEYDEDTQYYCAHGADLRPPCGSVFMGEGFFSGIERRFSKKGSKAYAARYKAWNDWSSNRGVSPWGRCAKFERKK
jgi:hypothetical protein